MATGLLRVVMCGAVDDGKSTLIGRLLAETGSVPQDELAAALIASSHSGSSAVPGTIDFSLLLDGLESERAQGITIDVAHRHLSLPSGRRVILADSPGHEQYTRNMAVASSTADVAVLVVDATRGAREQTLRHATVCRLMGVTSLIVAVNKLDAVENATVIFARLRAEFEDRLSSSRSLGTDSDSAPDLFFLALSGLRGDNVVSPSLDLPAGDFPTLVQALEASADRVARVQSAQNRALRLPIQAVIRDGSHRELAGRLASGSLAVGDRVTVWPSGASARVATLTNPHSVSRAQAGESVSVGLDTEVDASRGDILVPANPEPLPVSRAHLATLVWLDVRPLDLTASYLLRVGPLEVPARVDSVRFVVDLLSDEHEPGRPLRANDIGVVELTCDRPLLMDPFSSSHDSGGFILIDRLTGQTVAAGMSSRPLRRESEVVRHNFTVTRAARERLNGARSSVVWLTGLPGSGKSSVADELEKRLFERGLRSYVLDGDMVRQTLSEDLGFSPQDRAENVRRVARTAQIMMDAGLLVIVSLVSPYRADRALAREMFADSDFIEAFVDTPLAICIERDPKGLYARAAAASATSMTGVGQPYEEPLAPDIRLDGAGALEDAVSSLLSLILSRNAL